MTTLKRRRLRLDDWDALAAEVERLHADGYAKAGLWGLGEVCDHLRRVMLGSLEGFQEQEPWFVRNLAGPVILRVILWTRWMPAGVRAPDEVAPPRIKDAAESVRAFLEALALVREHAGAFAAHPAFGAISPEQWRRLHLIHCAHHLSFLVPGGAQPDATP
jgi:hypothetical protein